MHCFELSSRGISKEARVPDWAGAPVAEFFLMVSDSARYGLIRAGSIQNRPKQAPNQSDKGQNNCLKKPKTFHQNTPF